MKSLIWIFKVLAYVALVLPPRHASLLASHRESGGELASCSPFVAGVCELILRLGLLLVIATCLEATIGNLVYHQLKFDVYFGFLGGTGVLHFFFHYGFVSVNFGGRFHFQIYRLLRNLLYASLVALPVIFVLSAHQLFEARDIYTDDFLLSIYFYITMGALLLGLFEAFVSRRVPVGLDQLDISEKEGEGE